MYSTALLFSENSEYVYRGPIGTLPAVPRRVLSQERGKFAQRDAGGRPRQSAAPPSYLRNAAAWSTLWDPHSSSRVLTLRLYASRHFFITLARSGPPQRNVDPGRPRRPFQPGSGRFQAKKKPILVQSSLVLHLHYSTNIWPCTVMR